MGRTKKNITKTCITCGKEFNPGKHKEKINCSKECLKKYNELHKQERLEKSRKSIFEKYGVDHISKIEGHNDKVKETKKEKYGDENFNNREKAKGTLVKKNGVDNSMKLESTKRKAKETKKEKYGDENFNNRKKAEETIFKKTGKKHHLQTKESIEKMKQTNLKLYNVEYSIETEESKNRLKEKNIKKFGAEYYFSSNQYLQKTLKNKQDKIKNVLDSQELYFDVEKYEKLRKKNNKGKIQYLKYDIKCNICGNVFKSSLINKKIFCRKCYPLKKSKSIIQTELRDFFREMEVQFEENNREIIAPLEVDFYLKDNKLAFELNGNYWHSEIGGKKDKKYHLNKTLKCNEKDIKLIHIFEDEWILKKDIVKSRIRNLLNKTEHIIYARKCVIEEIKSEEKIEFLERNHIQGNSVDKIRIALKYKDEIVSVMTFSNNRIALGKKSNKNEYELIRFCSKMNTNVIGAFNKTLSYFIKKYNPQKITSYADCRWSGIDEKNTVYSKTGFNFIKHTSPSYFYVYKKDYCQRKHRFSFTKHKILQEFGGDVNKSEWQLAQENGYDRIWDCGTLKFEFVLCI